MKKRLSLISSIAVMIALFSVGSIAFFTHTINLSGTISTGIIEIAFSDNVVAKDEEVMFDGPIMPGDVIDQPIRILNTGDQEAWLRVRIDLICDEINEDHGFPYKMVAKSEDWILDNGWYYYVYRLEPGRENHELLTRVEFPITMDNRFQESEFSLSLHAEAIQSVNNATDVMSAVGWPSSSGNIGAK